MIPSNDQEVRTRYGVDLNRLKRLPDGVSAGLVRRTGLARQLSGQGLSPEREDCLVNILRAAGEEECLCLRFHQEARRDVEDGLSPDVRAPDRCLWLRSSSATELCILFPRE
jgi:hypothetical protein